MNFDINNFKKTNAKKTVTNIKYLRFKKEMHPEAFKLIALYNRSLDLEKIVNEFIKVEVLSKLEK